MTVRVYQERLPKKESAAAEFFFDLANERQISYRCSTTPPKIVTVRQDKDIEECTGGIVWETSFLLATFLEKQGLIEKNAKVLEVGAGCGMLGLVLACHGCRVILSEASEAITNLEKNVAAVVAAHHPNLLAKARLLRWDNAKDIAGAANSSDAPFDLILGTDVIFKPSLVEPLLQTISAMCHEATVIYLCFQERCADSHRLLMMLAPKYFEVADMSSSLQKTQGCHFASELECWLLQLTSCKRLSGVASKKNGRSANTCKARSLEKQNASIGVGIDSARVKKKKKKGKARSTAEGLGSHEICGTSAGACGGQSKKRRNREQRQAALDNSFREDGSNTGATQSTTERANSHLRQAIIEENVPEFGKKKQMRKKDLREA